jgi:hypothetical protein
MSDRSRSNTPSPLAGACAANRWLRAIWAPPPALSWHAEIALDVRDAPACAEFDRLIDTRFHVSIFAEEWGFFFCHQQRVSLIRVTDIPFVHGHDDHRLLAQTPMLDDIGAFVRELEQREHIQFQRKHGLVQTDLASAAPAIQSWLRAL